MKHAFGVVIIIMNNHDNINYAFVELFGLISNIIGTGEKFVINHFKDDFIKMVKQILNKTKSVNSKYNKIIVEKIYPYFCEHYFSN